MSCPDENLLLGYLQGVLAEDRQAAIEEHLDQCSTCHAVLSAATQSTVAEVPERESHHAPGVMVDHFRIMRLIGRGAMGEVYLGRDTRLGRRVALKLIRPDVLGSPTIRQRFITEAKTTARFNHPHIITIYEVGQWRGTPYLALEYIEGQNLRERMEEERQSIREVVRIGLAIAEALKEAHRHQVFHRDLKPANVLLPKDGLPRVVDFGLATFHQKEAFWALQQTLTRFSSGQDLAYKETTPEEGEARQLCGTPTYMAPEQWRGGECGAAADIWALGLILYELIDRRRPYQSSSVHQLQQLVLAPEAVPPLENREHLPLAIVELIERCLDKDPEQRPSAAQVAAMLEQILRPGGGWQHEEQSPFRGLLPFTERHAEVFFGRDGEVAAFLEQMRDQGVLPVVGSSGAGKTSFVQAGVIPRLREQMSWMILQLRPGPHPFRSLAARLVRLESAYRGRKDASASSASNSERISRVGSGMLELSPADHDEQQLAQELRAAPFSLNLVLRQLAIQHQCRVLLFVDQLEEVCSLCECAAERLAFMEAICAAGDDAEDPIRVIFTLRDDYLGRLAIGPLPRATLGRVTIIHNPEVERLYEMVSKPLSVVGYRYEDEALPREMVGEVEGERAALPLLQFTTQMLWDRRDPKRRLLLRQAYQQIGGVGGALARHADNLLAGLSQRESAIARHLILRLVTPERTRRSLTRSTLLEGLPDVAGEVLDRLIQGRLLSPQRQITTPEATMEDAASENIELELAHESLLTSWKKLAQWIDEIQGELAQLEALRQAALAWDRQGRRSAELWRGEPLLEAQTLCERDPLQLSERMRDFVTNGLQEERRQRRRHLRRRVLALGALVLVTVGSLAIALLLSQQRQEILSQRDEARRQRAEAQREAAQAAFKQQDYLPARARLRSSLEQQDSLEGRALWIQLQQTAERWRRLLHSNVYKVAFSPTGRRIAAACQDGSIYLLDRTGRVRRVLRGHSDQVFAVAFSPDGRRLASGAWNGEIRLWDLDRGSVKLLRGHRAAVWQLAFSPDGKRLASASWDKTVRLWQLAAPGEGQILSGHTDKVYGVAFSPDSKRLASASFDRTIRIWDVASGTLQHQGRAHQDRVYTVRWSPDGQYLASGGLDRGVILWSARDVQPLRSLPGHRHGVYAVAFSPDSRWLATVGGADHDLYLWDLRAPARRVAPLHLSGHTAGVNGLSFSPDGEELVSGGLDKTVRLWRVPTRAEQKIAAADELRRGHQGVTWGVAFSPDRRLLASSGLDRTIRLWRLDQPGREEVLAGHEALVTHLAFSPDGRLLASASADRTVKLWDVATRALQNTLIGHSAAVYGLAISPDGALLASGGSDKVIRLWALPSGQERKVLRGHQGGIWNVAFSPDGKWLASSSEDKTIRLWPLAQLDQAEARVLAGHSDVVYGVEYSPDGRWLASGSADGTVRLWDLRSRTSQILGRISGRFYYLAFHPAGQELYAPSSDGTIHIFRVADGQASVLNAHRSEVNTVRFSKDGRLAATTSDDGTVRLWDPATREPVWRTILFGRHPRRLLTHRGWYPAPPGGTSGVKWKQTLENRTRSAVAAPSGAQLCLYTTDGEVELWRTASDQRLFHEPLGSVEQILALDQGCMVLVGGDVRLYDRTGAFQRLAQHVTLLAEDAAGFLVARENTILLFDQQGRQRASYPGGVGLTAMTRDREFLALGWREGQLELVPLQPRALAARPRHLLFADLPSSPVVGLHLDRPGVLVAGFANGQWGVWSTANGAKLLSGRMHGPVSHIALEQDVLWLASELGEHEERSLSAFFIGYCDLLQRIWQELKVTWAAGLPVVQPPPADHRCRR